MFATGTGDPVPLPRDILSAPTPSSSVQNPLLVFHSTIGSPDVRGLDRKPRPACRGFSLSKRISVDIRGIMAQTPQAP